MIQNIDISNVNFISFLTNKLAVLISHFHNLLFPVKRDRVFPKRYTLIFRPALRKLGRIQSHY